MNYNKMVKLIIVAIVITLTFAILINNLNNFNVVHKHNRIIPTIIEEE